MHVSCNFPYNITENWIMFSAIFLMWSYVLEMN